MISTMQGKRLEVWEKKMVVTALQAIDNKYREDLAVIAQEKGEHSVEFIKSKDILDELTRVTKAIKEADKVLLASEW